MHFGGSVDVDITFKRISIVGVSPSEPENTAHNGIPAWRIGFDHLTRRPAAFKNSTRWLATTDFLSDFHMPQRSAVGTRIITNAEFRSGNFVGFDGLVVFHQYHLLIANTDDHFVVIIHLWPTATEYQSYKNSCC